MIWHHEVKKYHSNSGTVSYNDNNKQEKLELERTLVNQVFEDLHRTLDAAIEQIIMQKEVKSIASDSSVKIEELVYRRRIILDTYCGYVDIVQTKHRVKVLFWGKTIPIDQFTIGDYLASLHSFPIATIVYAVRRCIKEYTDCIAVRHCIKVRTIGAERAYTIGAERALGDTYD